MITTQISVPKFKKGHIKAGRRVSLKAGVGTNITRDAAINIRALSHQRDLIDRAAEATGKNRSDFMLEAACRQAEEVLLDRRMFLLDDAAYSKFTNLLDRAPKDNPKLRALLSKKAPWGK